MSNDQPARDPGQPMGGPRRFSRALLASASIARRVVRPALTALKVAALIGILSVAFLVAGSSIGALHDAYGFHPARNAAVWAGLTPRYADSAICQACHASQYAQWSSSKHASVACESCHGPLAAHAADPRTAFGASPSAEICASCHEKTVGRPSTFPQVDLTVHFDAGLCLQCHTGHGTGAKVPPLVVHPLANLPDCLTCHGRQGMNPAPADHEPSADAICLACHSPDRRSVDQGSSP